MAEIISIVSQAWQVSRNSAIVSELSKSVPDLRHIYVSTEEVIGGNASSSQVASYEEMRVAKCISVRGIFRGKVLRAYRMQLLVAIWARSFRGDLRPEARPVVLTDNVRSPRNLIDEIILRSLTRQSRVVLVQHSMHERVWFDRFPNKRRLLRLYNSFLFMLATASLCNRARFGQLIQALRTVLGAIWNCKNSSIDHATSLVIDDVDRALLVADGVPESQVEVVGALEYFDADLTFHETEKLRPEAVVDFFTSGNFRFSKRHMFHLKEIGLIGEVGQFLNGKLLLRVWSKPGESERVQILARERGITSVAFSGAQWAGFESSRPNYVIAGAGSSIVIKALLSGIPILGFVTPQLREGDHLNLAEQFGCEYVDPYADTLGSDVVAALSRLTTQDSQSSATNYLAKALGEDAHWQAATVISALLGRTAGS